MTNESFAKLQSFCISDNWFNEFIAEYSQYSVNSGADICPIKKQIHMLIYWKIKCFVTRTKNNKWQRIPVC